MAIRRGKVVVDDCMLVRFHNPKDITSALRNAQIRVEEEGFDLLSQRGYIIGTCPQFLPVEAGQPLPEYRVYPANERCSEFLIAHAPAVGG